MPIKKKRKYRKHAIKPHLVIMAIGIPRMQTKQRKRLAVWLKNLGGTLEESGKSVAEIFTGIFP